MDRTAEIEATRQQLMRIVALLLALAGLAESACQAPFSVRVLVIGVLRLAESVAWDLAVAGMELPATLPGDAGYGPGSAARLAERFCALAVLLAGIAARLVVAGEARIGFLQAGDAARIDVSCPAALEPRPFDTS